MQKILLCFFLCSLGSLYSQFSTDSILGSNQTPTYSELIQFYTQLAEDHSDVQLFQMGQSDYGLPIYLCVLNHEDADSANVFSALRNGSTLLINNAIHPGEPCGVNASMELARTFIQRPAKEKVQFPFIAIIPAYNVGGMMNRGSYSRANQIGPDEHGFRGNASNLDLNRDFIKMDSKNMFTFAKLFHGIDPDLFIDTHTSNGADYQYTITYIDPIMEKLAPSMQRVFEERLIPYLKSNVQERSGFELFPYVNLKGNVPSDGMVHFNATPRYSMGYADLFHTFSFTTETHMLKPFQDRVKSTLAFLESAAGFLRQYKNEVEEARIEARSYDLNSQSFPINYKTDTIPESIFFKGYYWEYQDSEVTTGDRLKYDRSKPMEMRIPYYHQFTATDSIQVPEFYVVSGQARTVIERLKSNQVDFMTIQRDSTMTLTAYKVEAYQTAQSPYEGHYLHYDVQVQSNEKAVRLKKGDVIIPTNQQRRRFIVKVLHPTYVDSYFAWNFFDSYLQQKEHFSAYVFEDIAKELLNEDEVLRKSFTERMKVDEEFAKNRYAQLRFIYNHSPYYEGHGILPVYTSD